MTNTLNFNQVNPGETTEWPVLQVKIKKKKKLKKITGDPFENRKRCKWWLKVNKLTPLTAKTRWRYFFKGRKQHILGPLRNQTDKIWARGGTWYPKTAGFAKSSSSGRLKRATLRLRDNGLKHYRRWKRGTNRWRTWRDLGPSETKTNTGSIHSWDKRKSHLGTRAHQTTLPSFQIVSFFPFSGLSLVKFGCDQAEGVLDIKGTWNKKKWINQ